MWTWSRFGLFCLGLLLAACSGARSILPGGGGVGTSGSGQRVALIAGYRVLEFHYHIMPLRTPPKAQSLAPPALQYPDDLTNYGGRIMKSEASYDIDVDCPHASCWGGVEPFQKSLTGSAFASLLRQYTGTGPNSFTFGGSTLVTYPVYRGTALYENDLMQILHSVAAATKRVGYSYLYHIFLPKGVDTCVDFSRQCYSPDYAPTNAFCAYHGSVTYSDLGTVIYSVEPYQDVKGCRTPRSTGASALTNSTISTLAHETFEAITDPGPGLAWYNYQGGEIGDECEFFFASVRLGGITYTSQPMYSNKYHACATGP